MEEFLAGLREIEETGGFQLEDFIQELEELASGERQPPDDRASGG